MPAVTYSFQVRSIDGYFVVGKNSRVFFVQKYVDLNMFIAPLDGG